MGGKLQSYVKGDPRAIQGGKKSKRGISLKRVLKEFLQKQADDNGSLSPENIIKAMTLHGMKGNSAMLKLMFEYIDGKVEDKVTAKVETELTIIKQRGDDK